MKSLIISDLFYDLFDDVELHIFDNIKYMYDESENYHIISKNKIQSLIFNAHAVNMWLSAALDDEKVCKEMKDDINNWFESLFSFIRENNIDQYTFYKENK